MVLVSNHRCVASAFRLFLRVGNEGFFIPDIVSGANMRFAALPGGAAQGKEEGASQPSRQIEEASEKHGAGSHGRRSAGQVG